MKVISDPLSGTVTLRFNSIEDIQAHYSNLKRMIDANRTRTDGAILEYEMSPDDETMRRILAAREEERNNA